MGLDGAGQPVPIDLAELLATRLLVQGNSGSGKSHLLRRLLERSAGQVQQIIIDPEGDFVTLGDAYGHIAISALEYSIAEVAIFGARIREHRTSVVLDLEGLEMEGQMRCAAAFLGALFDAPREHWYPALVVVDEAQVFAPSQGAEVTEEVRRASLGRDDQSHVPWAQAWAGRDHRDAAPRQARQERRGGSVQFPDGAHLSRHRHGARGRSAGDGAAAGRADPRSGARHVPRAGAGGVAAAGGDPDRAGRDGIARRRADAHAAAAAASGRDAAIPVCRNGGAGPPRAATTAASAACRATARPDRDRGCARTRARRAPP